MAVPRKDFRNIISGFASYIKEIDLPLLATLVAICFFSIANMFGIVGIESTFFSKHLVFLGIGLGIMFLMSSIDYRYFKNYSLPSLILYALSLFLLLLTFYSQAVRGSNAWIIFGGFTFEPSELAKLMLIILLAKYFSQRHVHIRQLKHIIASGFYFLIPTGIVLNQPDLGSAVMFTFIWIGMLLAAGINKKHLFFIFVLGAVLSYSAWLFALEPYQKDRIKTFLDPGRDPRGSGYNIIQSKIAIGAGGLFGEGLGKGSQSRLGFLPEPHNDFAFAAAAEQFGFAGILGLLSLMGLLIFRIFSIGARSANNFSRLFCIGMSIFVFVHVAVSASVNIGLMPVTGLPFSLLSYGGSHIVSIMAGLGIVQSIKRFG